VVTLFAPLLAPLNLAEDQKVRYRSYAVIRHPGLDPGPVAALKSWTPDQVRGDEEG